MSVELISGLIAMLAVGAALGGLILTRGLSRNGVKNYSKGPCVTILE